MVPWTDAVHTDWDRLAAASRNIFATREWAEAWWRHHGSGCTVQIVLFRRASGEIAGLLPFVQGGGRRRAVVRVLGHGPADESGPICAPGDRPAMAAALPQALAASGGRITLLERLPASTDWTGTTGGRVVAREPSPVLALPHGSWDDLLAGWSANRRGQARRIERQIDRAHGHVYTMTTDEDRLAPDLDALFALHRARWGAVTPFIRDQAFHRDFARTALTRGWLRLRRMEIGGRPVATWYGLRFGEVESYYQAGRDPEFERDGVGRALLLHSIRMAVESGATEYRFLRGDEAFKTRYATHDHGIVTIAFGRDPVSRGLIALADRARRTRAARTLRRRATDRSAAA